MSAFAGWLNGLVSSILVWIYDLVAGVFGGVWDMLTDGLVYVIDKLLDLAIYAIGSMNWNFGSFSPGQYWAMLPAEMVNVLNILGVPVALGMIVAALSIRFMLQLIPFVRLGS